MTVITPDTKTGGMRYPYLPINGWKIVTTKLGSKKVLKKLKTEHDGITLREVKSDKVVDIFIEGFDGPEQWLKHLGMTISLKKGGFVLSKRLSRLMRPYFFWAFFKDRRSIRIKVDNTLDKKAWDGAGLIKREFLRKLTRNLPEERVKELTGRLMHTGRVEFTLQTPKGQYKGHALVVDELDADIVVPDDPKLEVLTKNIFVGVAPVKSHKHMWLDVQSLINFYPFLDTATLIPWLVKAGDDFLKEIESGEISKIYERVSSMRDVEGWHIWEYLASQGDPMWFAAVIKALANQHIKRIKARGLEHLRLPIPGGYYYVFNDVVGNRKIPAGHIEIDDAHSSAWISREDWEWLSAVWGGADMDDALWIFPFHDYDGDLKVLAWRSPNQLGEYVLLKPTDAMVENTEWAEWPELDSRKLPTRIDKMDVEYLGLAQEIKHVDAPYSIEKMTDSITAAVRNIGGIGQIVNGMMTVKAMNGKLPQKQADRLERVIDNEVKLGGSNVLVKRWWKAYIRKFVVKHYRLPRVLVPRVRGMLTTDQRDSIIYTHDHWLDDLVSRMQTEVWAYKRKVKVLAAKAMPPIQVLQYGLGYEKQAARIKAVYGNEIMKAVAKGPIKPETYEVARAASENILREYPVKDWTRIMAAISLRTYVLAESSIRDSAQRSPSDASMWQLGKKVEGRRRRGIVHITLAMLREVGVIAELIEINGEIIPYYAKDVPVGVPIRLNGTWFAYASYAIEKSGAAKPEKMGDVEKPMQLKYKRLVEERSSKLMYVGQPLLVKTAEWNGETRKVLYKGDHLFGYVDKRHEHRVTSDSVTPSITFSRDGDLIMVLGGEHEAREDSAPVEAKATG